MDEMMANAFTEVNQILDILGDKYKSQVPKDLLDLFEKKQNPNFKTNINKNQRVEEMDITRQALIIISILNLRYWEKDPEKIAELKKIYKANEDKFQEKVNAFRDNEDWLVTKKEEPKEFEEHESVKDEFALVAQENSLVNRIKLFFLRLFSRK